MSATITQEEVLRKTNDFLWNNTKPKQYFLLLYTLTLVFSVIFSIFYSLLNPYFFLLLLPTSLAIIHYIIAMFMMIFNDIVFFNYWKEPENREIIIRSKFKLMIQYVLPLYILLPSLFGIFYFDSRVDTELMSLELSVIEITLIIAHFLTGYLAGLLLTKWIVTSYIAFDSYNYDSNLVGMNLDLLLKGLVFLIIWWVPLFVMEIFYIAIYEEDVTGNPVMILLTLFLLNLVVIALTRLPRFKPDPNRKVIYPVVEDLIQSRIDKENT